MVATPPSRSNNVFLRSRPQTHKVFLALQPAVVASKRPSRSKRERHRGRTTSELAARHQPGTFEVQVGLGAKNVEVAVVVQNAKAVPVRGRREDEVDGWQPVMAGVCKLALRI